MKTIKILRKMTENIESKKRDSKEASNYKKYQKLKILLERTKRKIKYRHKLRKRYYKKLIKLKLQLIKTKKLNEQLENKIKILNKQKEILQKAIRKRIRIIILVRKKRLQRLKMMGELRESDQKRYLNELKAERNRRQRFRKRPKTIHPVIKKIQRKLKISKQKLELVRKDIKSLKFRINKVKHKKNFLGIQKWQKKFKKILNKLKLIKQNEPNIFNEKPIPKVLQQQIPIVYQETPETKIIEFKAERKVQIPNSLTSTNPKRQLKSLKAIEGTTVSLKLPESSYNKLPELNTTLAIQRKKVINEPIPIGDKQTENFKDTTSIRDDKHKVFKLSKKIYKVKEPVPIGDKRDEDQEKLIKRKRFSRYSRRRSLSRTKSSRTSTSSDSYRKNYISKHDKRNTSDSDGKYDNIALPPTPLKRRSFRSIKLKKYNLSKDSKNSSTDAEKDSTSLKIATSDTDSATLNTSHFKDKFKRKKIMRVKQFSMNIEAMRNSYKNYNKSKMKLRTHLYKKPIDKRTLLPISVPRTKRELMLLPRSSLKQRAAIRFREENDNEENERDDQKNGLKTNIYLYKVDEKKILHSTHPTSSEAIKSLPKISKKPLIIYDENFYQKLVRLYRPSIREKINMERRKMLEQQKQEKEAKAAELRARESMNRKAMFQRLDALQRTESDELENLVKLGLKSNYNVIDVVPSDIAVIDDYILKMAPKTKRVNIQNLLLSTKLEQTTLKDSLKEIPRKTTKNVKPRKKSLKKTNPSTSKRKKDQLKKKVQENSRSFTDMEEVSVYDKESLVTEKDLWNYNDDITDDLEAAELHSIPVDQNKKSDESKTTRKKKIPGSRKNKEAWSKCADSADISDNKEQIVKIICSACGMTDMQPGGACCPIIPKTA